MTSNLSPFFKALLATVLYIIGIGLTSTWYLIAEAVGYNNTDDYYLPIQGVLQCLVVVIFSYFIHHKTFNHLVQQIDKRWYLLAIISGISFVYIQTPINWIYNTLFHEHYNIQYEFDGWYKMKKVMFYIVAIVVPIGEELYFRGFVQNYLQKKYNAYLTIILSALFFSSIHAPYFNLVSELYKQNWHLFYITFFGGLISAYLFHKSKSIIPSILFHIFWNITVQIA
jgi:membrane protease YdiL (CAAX protease family)